MTADLLTASLLEEAPWPHGLRYRTDFLDPADEQGLLALLPTLPLQEARFQQFTARRRVVRFGELYDEDSRAWVQGPSLPPLLDALRARVAEWVGIASADFVHVLATEYRSGTPIGWHRDKPHYGIVAGVSLGAACRMRFRQLDEHAAAHRAMTLALAPRSVYLMRDAIRWGWQHHIPPVKGLRYSVTFRTRAPETVKRAPRAA